MGKNKGIKIFYSWQNDLSAETNKALIRRSINDAKGIIECEFDDELEIFIDEATRDTPGSPNIPATILTKITSSDIFIADVSIIRKSNEMERACPNPNVVYELGYATAHLGWERIIMLFNEEFGNLSSDLPFDFATQRVSSYKVRDKLDNNGKRRLVDLLCDAIKMVIAKNPKRASEQKILSPEETRKIRDTEKIKKVFLALNLPTIDRHLENSPHIVTAEIIYFWEVYNSILISSLFHLYDKEFESDLMELHQAWEISMSPNYYRPASGDSYVFMDDNFPLPISKKEAWDKIC